MDYENLKNVDIPELGTGIYSDLLNRALAELDHSLLYKGGYLHKDDHIIRTMINGAVIAKGEDFGAEDTALLLLCCGYHDIGRHNDAKDPGHGCAAAKRIICGDVPAFLSVPEDDMRAAAAAIAAHSTNTASVERFGDEFFVRNREKMQKLVKALKDADNLDRVRLGDLDPNRLRTDTARRCVDFARRNYMRFPPD